MKSNRNMQFKINNRTNNKNAAATAASITTNNRTKTTTAATCLLLTWFILVASIPTPANAVIEDVLDIIHIVKEVTTGILKAWDIVQSSPLAANIEFPLMREKQRKVLQRLKEVTRQIDQTEEKHAQNVALAIESVNDFISTNAPLIAKMNDITDTMNRISSRYQQMQQYEEHKDKLEMSTLITFAEWTVSPNAYSVHHLMDRLHLTLIGNGLGSGSGGSITTNNHSKDEQPNNSSSSFPSTTNLLSQLAQNYENIMMSETTSDNLEERAVLDVTETVLRNDKTFSMSRIYQDIELIMVKQALYYRALTTSTDQICHTLQSPQQFIYSLYADIALTELKGYTMMEFSWMMLRVYGKGNFTQEAQLMRSDYEKRTERTLKLLREIMRRADRIIWRCDPLKHVAGKTYDEVTRLLQGFVENEVDLNNDETCRETCDFYQSTRSEGCFKELYCARQPKCSGRLYNCGFVDSDMWVCPAPLNSTRRYDYIEYENGRVLGKKDHCVRGTTKVDSWWRYIFWHCSYCFCLCDEQGPKSDRYFNLRESLADAKQNRVVTGLRFVKHNRIFHLQIQEGELLPRGAINQSSLVWKPVEEYKIHDRSVRNGQDYHTLSYESRSIDLDDITSDEHTFVVTGVRFRVVGAHLNLEARLTEINFETGQLVLPEVNSFWKSNDNTDVSGGERRQKIKLMNPDVSTRTIVKSIPDSRHNQYVDFVNTSMDKDAAQNTVPYIDIQDVFSNPPVPLSGIGIYHKGRQGYGGFLAPKLITYDFTPHVQLPKGSNQKPY